MANIQDIIAENDKRVAILNQPYNPITGEGSPIERFPVYFFESSTRPVFLPVSMRQLDIIQDFIRSQKRTIESYCISKGLDTEQTANAIHEARQDHDFEFWCYTTVKIKPKTGGKLIQFKLNKAQRKIVGRMEAQRQAGKPIRLILLKARQLGGSTVIQIYISWIQIRHKTNWNSLIAAHINQAATNIRSMMKTVITNYPLQSLSFRPFEGTHNIKIVPERSNKITIGSMETPDSIRSEDAACFHGSEISSWKKTDGKKPEDLIQSILGTILDTPYTVVALESTAKGVGNYFHRTWTEAKRTGVYDPIFVAWWEIEMYQKPFESEKEKIDLIKSMSEYEKQIWGYGATLEGLKWHRYKLSEYNGDMTIMSAEFPSDDVEAFQSSGHRFFPVAVVQKARKFVSKPLYVGEVYGDAMKGPEALQNIRVEKANQGNYSVWAEPEIYPDVKYLNRYCVTVDIGGRSKGADDSVIKVYDRFWMMDGGAPELAACWAGKIDFDHLAWKAVQICKMYDDAFMIPEINKMREDTSNFDEGDQFYTLVDEIVGHYGNIFCRTNPEQILKGMPTLYGFHMNIQTKPMVLNALNAAYRDDAIINHDSRSMDQADSFENKGNGKTGAVEGGNDDHVIADALAAWGCIHYMPPVQEVELKPEKIRKPANNIASF